eukprot:2812390-Heterocapsa_arctica.AAC.1
MSISNMSLCVPMRLHLVDLVVVVQGQVDPSSLTHHLHPKRVMTPLRAEWSTSIVVQDLILAELLVDLDDGVAGRSAARRRHSTRSSASPCP